MTSRDNDDIDFAGGTRRKTKTNATSDNAENNDDDSS